jgi:hypothetical protein
VPVLLEEGLRRRVVLVARHDEPVQRPPVAPARGEDLLGEDLEEGLAPDGRHGKRPLGAVVAEAGSLPAGDRERRHASRPERRSPPPSRLTRRAPRRRGQAGARRGPGPGPSGPRQGLPRRTSVRTSRSTSARSISGRLGEQPLPGAGIQLLVEGEYLPLAGLAEGLNQRGSGSGVMGRADQSSKRKMSSSGLAKPSFFRITLST